MAASRDGDFLAPVQLNLQMLPVCLVPERAISDEEFQRFCLKNDSVQIERDSDGIIHLYPLNGFMTSDANSEITARLRNWSTSNNVGRAVGSSVGFFLPDGSMLCPNASLISNAKWHSLSREELEGIPHLTPDFVIELVSNWKTLEKLRWKMAL